MENIKIQQVNISLLWISGHSRIPGHNAANNLAKAAIGPTETYSFRHSTTTHIKWNRTEMFQDWQREWQTTEKGKHLQRINNRLPSKHTQSLYRAWLRNRAYLLTQLRTGHLWLTTHTKIFGFTEENKYKYGAQETVKYILVDCPKLKEIKQQLQNKIGNAFNSTTEMLRGRL